MSMKRGLLQASLGLSAVVFFVLAIRGDQNGRLPDTKPGDKTEFNRNELAAKEKLLEEKFARFELALLRLKQRLEKSDRKEDRDRAVQLQKVLDKSGDRSIATRFSELVRFLSNQKMQKIGELKDALKQSADLAADLRDLLELLRNSNSSASRKEERLRLEQLLKELERVIRDQRIVNGRIESGRMDPKQVAQNQRDVRKDTNDLANKLGKLNQDDKNGKGGEAKDTKGEAKEGKGKGAKGEGKNAGKSGAGKKGEGKNAGKSGAGKKGEAKDANKGKKDGQKGEAKGGKAGDPKQGDAKGGKGSEAKQGAQAKGGDPKQGGAKAGDPKGEKQGQAKNGGEKTKVRERPKDGEKQGGAKAGDPKSGQKQGGAKASKGGESKQGAQSKGDPQKGAQGESKSSKSSGQGSPKSGTPKSGDQDEPKDAGNKKNGDPQDNTQDAKKRIHDAEQFQYGAEKKIAQKQQRPALKDGEDAVTELEKAKKKLEDLLRQLREEELERLLTDLKNRCEKMLAMQIQVYNGTKAVFRAIDGNKDKKPARANIQDSVNLSDDEKKIVHEATKAIEMLEAEGSAVAFHEVFTQVRDDMKNVQRRLNTVDVGKVTQAVEQDIIDTLQEMIKALEKQIQQNKKNPPPSNGGPPPPQADQKLLDKIAELKMIRAMQLRVNRRTELYGNQYKGEQANEPPLQRELRNLADRQDRIFEVTNKIAKGDNQ